MYSGLGDVQHGAPSDYNLFFVIVFAAPVQICRRADGVVSVCPSVLLQAVCHVRV